LDLHGRQLEIVRGIFNDQTEFALAADLGISPHTVHTYWERVRMKLSARTRVEMVVVVMREYLRRRRSPGA
jgi:DNA-binding CsgD family transcriptional regulator